MRNLPDNAERDRQEFHLQMAINRSVFSLNPGDPECEAVLTRARDLSEQLGDDGKQMEALLQLAQFRHLRREYGVARELCHRVLSLAEPARATAMVAGAHYMLGTISSFLGHFDAAREHLELALGLFGSGPFRNFDEAQYVQGATMALSITLLLLGYPAAAQSKSREFLDAMRRLSEPVVLAIAFFREASVTHGFGIAGRSSNKPRNSFRSLPSTGCAFIPRQPPFFRGWVLAYEGRRGQEGLAEMSQALPALEGAPMSAAWYARLGDSYRRNGRSEEGLTTVDRALREMERGGERNFLAEIYRVKGELLLARDPPGDAEAERCFRTAIDIARRQKARFLELRATTSLARLLKRQDKRDEARRMLAEIYGWFTEGFEFADLKDAKPLLDELST